MDLMRIDSTSGFDQLDMKLIKELESDARQSNGELARKLGIPKTTVRRRIQQFIDQGVLAFAAIPDPSVLGFQGSVLIGIKVRPGKLDNAVAHLASLKRVRTISTTTGLYDMVIYTAFHESNELPGFLATELGCTPDLVNAETMTVVRLVKNSWGPWGEVGFEHTEKMPGNLDESELMLIRELELSPRESIINLAKKIGINRALVSKKLQTLLKDNIVKVVGVTDPSAFGFDVQALILVKVHPGEITAAADYLAANGSVNTVVIITGRFDIFVWVVFRHHKEMSDFIRNHVANVPGVIHYETMLHQGHAKKAFALLTQEDPL